MKKTSIILSILLLALLIFFQQCFKNEEKSSRVLKMVFVPASEKGDKNDFASLITVLEKITPFKFETINVTDYNSAVEAMRVGRADIAWYGAKTYIHAAAIADAEAFAVGIPIGKTSAFYYTHFIVKKDNPLQFTREELKGKVLALNHIGSTSGDLIPRYELLKIGIDNNREEHFKMIQYTGSHDSAIMSVLHGRADLAGVSSVNWEARIKDGTINPSDFRIIHTSSPIAGAPLAYSKKLPLDVRKTIKAAVLEAHKHGPIGGYGGVMERYIEVSDSDYDIIRDISRLIKK